MLTSLIAAALIAGHSDRQEEPWALVAEARSHLAGPASGLWPGWADTPFGLVIVGEAEERLVCDGRAPEGFGAPSTEPVTGCEVRSRPRTFPSGLVAAMPAFGPPSVVVVGEPELTGLSDVDWTRVLLHEHFHQHQTAAPDYWARVEALDLSGGDQTGMWMLNYPFPYDRPGTAEAARAAAARLAEILSAEGPPSAEALNAYVQARRAFETSVPEPDWRYADFQMWQEGVARWTEATAAELSDDPAQRAAGAALKAETLDQLRNLDLAAQRRIAFYVLGAGEAELLDRFGAEWRGAYFDALAMSPLIARLPE